MNWSAFEAKVLAIVEKVMKKIMRQYDERWVTADELQTYVGTLTPRFMKDKGDMFNRTRVEWDEVDENGNVRHVVSREWLYPLHEIQEWVANGKIKELKKNTFKDSHFTHTLDATAVAWPEHINFEIFDFQPAVKFAGFTTKQAQKKIFGRFAEWTKARWHNPLKEML